MNNLTTINLELGISAQKMIQQVQIHNETIESEISKGVQMAIEEILSDDNLSIRIKEQTIKAIDDVVLKAVLSWEVRNRISKMIEEKIILKIQSYADEIAEKVTSNLR